MKLEVGDLSTLDRRLLRKMIEDAEAAEYVGIVIRRADGQYMHAPAEWLRDAVLS